MLNIKLVALLLVATLVVNTPVLHSMDMIKSKTQWVTSKISNVKEKTLDRLVKQYRATRELRRKKAEGIATPDELRKLEQRMKKIRMAAASIGVAIIVIAGGVYFYGKYRKIEKVKKPKESEDESNFSSEEIGGENESSASEKNVKQEKTDYSLSAWIKAGDTLFNSNQIVSGPDISIQEVKKQLDAGADPNGNNFLGLPPLLHAVQFDRGDLVDLLVSKGANPNFRFKGKTSPRHDYTLLMNPVVDNNHSMVDKLLEKGADPQATLPGVGDVLSLANKLSVDARIISSLKKALRKCDVKQWDEEIAQKWDIRVEQGGLSITKRH